MSTNYAFPRKSATEIRKAQASIDATRESVRATVAGIVIDAWRLAKADGVSISAFVKAYRADAATSDYSGGWAEAIVKADNATGNAKDAATVVKRYLADAKRKNDAQAAKRAAAKNGKDDATSPADSAPRTIDYISADADTVVKHIRAILLSREDGKAILATVVASFAPVKSK